MVQVAPASPSPRLADKTRRRRQLISLTPLIDVVFILLVFFMLASSFAQWHSIELTSSSTSGRSTTTTDTPAMTVEVATDGLRLDGEAVTPAELETRVGAEPDRTVLVRPAAEVGLQNVVAVLDRLSRAGNGNVKLVGGSTE